MPHPVRVQHRHIKTTTSGVDETSHVAQQRPDLCRWSTCRNPPQPHQRRHSQIWVGHQQLIEGLSTIRRELGLQTSIGLCPRPPPRRHDRSFHGRHSRPNHTLSHQVVTRHREQRHRAVVFQRPLTKPTLKLLHLTRTGTTEPHMLLHSRHVPPAGHSPLRVPGQILREASSCPATNSTTEPGADSRSSGTNPSSRSAPTCKPPASRAGGPSRAHTNSRSAGPNKKHRFRSSVPTTAGKRMRASRSASLKNPPRCTHITPKPEPYRPAPPPTESTTASTHITTHRIIDRYISSI